jgi:hypothetical protein
MGYRQYTHCVKPADYVDNTPPAAWWAKLLDPNVPAWVATACDYLLGGKLVCLGDGTDQCAIGHITHFEPASDKSFPDNIDNDFSMNIVLAPHGLTTGASYLDNYKSIANDGYQGWLIQEQPGMPLPHESDSPDDKSSPPQPWPDDARFQGYATKYPDSNYPEYDPAQSPFQVDGSDGHPFWVPSFHLECEGSRIHDVCAAIAAVQGPASAVCDVPIIGWAICFLVDLVTLPVLLPAIAIAWANATDGDANDPRVGGGGQLKLGDLIVVTGRWVYDAGHQGWNEFHPVKRIQLVPPEGTDWGSDFTTWRDAWCEATSHCPPYAPPGSQPTDMTPAQTTTYDNQLDPSNQWVYHPAIDGCGPLEGPPPPPGPPPPR